VTKDEPKGVEKVGVKKADEQEPVADAQEPLSEKEESVEAKPTEDEESEVESTEQDSKKRSSEVKRRRKKKSVEVEQSVAKEAGEQEPVADAQEPLSGQVVDGSSVTEATNREPIENQSARSESPSEIPEVPLDSYISELTQAGRLDHGQTGTASATNSSVGEQLSLGIAGAEAEESPERAARRQLKRVVESLVFVSDKPLSVAQIRKIARARTAEVTSILKELVQDYQDRGIELVEVGGGYTFRSAPHCAAFVRDLVAQRPVRLSQAQLETLSIVAYRQPVTRPEIEEIRGVDTGSAIKVLLERGLLKMLGRKDEPGRPLLYGTTPYFLEFFGMNNLKDLPTLREFSDLNEENRELFKRKTGESVEDAKSALSVTPPPSDSADGTSEQNGETDVDQDVVEEEIQQPTVGFEQDFADQESEFPPLINQEAKDEEEKSREERYDLNNELEEERVDIDYDDV